MMNKLWDKQEEESEQHFRSFVIFRDLPMKERSLRKVETITGHSINSMRNWSTKYSWIERAAAYDIYDHDIETQTHREQLANQQAEIIEDGFLDYQRLVGLWTTLVEGEEEITYNKLNNLVNTRLKIDALGRRASLLPLVHTTEILTHQEGTIKLNWKDAPQLIQGKLKED